MRHAYYVQANPGVHTGPLTCVLYNYYVETYEQKSTTAIN